MKFVLITLAIALVAWPMLKFASRRRPPAVGRPAPDFSLPDTANHMHHLADYRGQWLVLYFSPRIDAPAFAAEADALRDAWDELRAGKVAALGISMDAPSDQRAFASQHQLPFPLLADLTGKVTRAYGALWDMGLLCLPRRYAFLIDPSGRLARVYLKAMPDRSVRTLLKDLATI